MGGTYEDTIEMVGAQSEVVLPVAAGTAALLGVEPEGAWAAGTPTDRALTIALVRNRPELLAIALKGGPKLMGLDKDVKAITEIIHPIPSGAIKHLQYPVAPLVMPR